jgi:hypothetical protein
MPQSKTRLMHTCPTERPFYCITGDLSGEGFLVVVDRSTHELVVEEGAEAGTVTVIVNPIGVRVTGVSVRPGTRMLVLTSSSAVPMKQAAESIERLKAEQPEALALAKLLKTAVATAHWELGLDAFCQLFGFNPEHEHGREKFRAFDRLAGALNQFDERSVANLLEWQAQRELHLGSNEQVLPES